MFSRLADEIASFQPGVTHGLIAFPVPFYYLLSSD